MLSSMEVDRLVQEYQDGVDGTAGLLLEAFQPYLTKWENIIRCRHINTLDVEVQAFVSLFGAPDLFHISKILRLAIANLQDGEIGSKLTELFLDRLYNYESVGRTFLGYLRATYKYIVFHWIRKLVRNLSIIYDSNIVDEVTVEPTQNDRLDELDLQDAMSELTNKERRFLYMRFIDGMSNDEIGNVMGITSDSVSQIISKSRVKLREHLS